MPILHTQRKKSSQETLKDKKEIKLGNIPKPSCQIFTRKIANLKNPGSKNFDTRRLFIVV